MHERTQRAVARLLFVFCCAVPTCCVVAIVLITCTAWYRSRLVAGIEHELGQETGLAVQIGSYEKISPEKCVLHEVRLNHPESGNCVATVRTIDWFRGRRRTGVVLHQPELHSVELGSAWKLLHDRLIRRPEHTSIPIGVAATDLTIRSRTGSLTLRDVSATVTPEKDGVRMILEAGDVTQRNESSLRVSLFRDRSTLPPTSEITISTDQTSLPCSIFAEYVPFARQLGPEAQFSGTMRFQETASGWMYDLDGLSLTDIDLSRLSEDLPHRITGVAQIHFDRCRVRPNETVNVYGDIYARGGWIGRNLLYGMKSQLGFAIAPAVLENGNDSVQYSSAALHVEITEERMSLEGICRPNQDYAGDVPGTAFCAWGRPILQTVRSEFAAERVTAVISPPRASLSIWKQIFLPSPASPPPDTTPQAQISAAGRWSGGELIRQE